MFPPSIHATGVRYRRRNGVSLDDVDLLPFPDALRDLLSSNPSNGQIMQEDLGSFEVHPGASQGQRNKILCQLIGSHMCEYGITPELPIWAQAWADHCQPPMDQADVVRTVTALIEKEQTKRSTIEQQHSAAPTAASKNVEITV